MSDPLHTVLKLAKDAEHKAALSLKAAQLERQKCKVQLEALNHYRVDYTKTLTCKQNEQLSGVFYQQLYKFIKQIDDAIVQQLETLSKLEQVCEQRLQCWLKQQQKCQAIEFLLKKKSQQRQRIENQREQKIADEFSVQQFCRRKI